MCIYTLGKLSSFFNRLKLFLSLNMINKIQENILSLRVSQSAIFFEIIYLSACCESFEFPLEIVSRHHHLSSTCFLPFPKTVTRYDFETSITPGGKTAERSQSLFRLIAILFAAVDSMHSPRQPCSFSSCSDSHKGKCIVANSGRARPIYSPREISSFRGARFDFSTLSCDSALREEEEAKGRPPA